MAKEMKKMIIQNRENEKLKRLIETLNAFKKESEEEGQHENQKYMENFK